MLQVGEQRVEKNIIGNAKPQSSASAIVIGGGFQGLLNQFRVIDWNGPMLAALPNGQTEMSVTIGAGGSASIKLSSTGKNGQRPIASYDPRNPLGLPIANAYAQNSSAGWWGDVKAGAQTAAVALVDSITYIEQTKRAFQLGLILGDTSMPAGMVGDMVMGFIPFGDSRDVALQNYYKYYGNPEDYDEIILYLAYIGLGADALMIGFPVVGGPLNAAVATIKPAVKLIRKMPMRGVLAKEFSDLAAMARQANQSGDWTAFRGRAEIILPFLQLFAAVALDDDLRNLLSGAVRNSVDLENWLKYIARSTDTLVAQRKSTAIIPEAYASTSAIRQILKNYDAYLNKLDETGERAGAILADSVGAINEIAVAAKWPVELLKQEEALLAVANIGKLGGYDALRKMSQFDNFGRFSIEKVTTALSTLNLSKDKISPEALDGIKRVINELGEGGYKAQGAAHHLRTIVHVQKQAGVLITDIEKQAPVIINGTKLNHQRRSDVIYKIGGTVTHGESKSWRNDKIKEYTKMYLGVSGNYDKAIVGTADEIAEHAKVISNFKEKGAQLFPDLLSFAQDGFKGRKWFLDDRVTDGGEVFKDTIIEALEKNSALRTKIKDVLSKGNDRLSEDQLNKWIRDLDDHIDDFIEIIPAV